MRLHRPGPAVPQHLPPTYVSDQLPPRPSLTSPMDHDISLRLATPESTLLMRIFASPCPPLPPTLRMETTVVINVSSPETDLSHSAEQLSD